jgi:rhodanese-related sulfurtransferase
VELHGREDVSVLDVRESDEWQAGHIDGSIHIPMSELGQRLAELDPATPFVTVCRSGQRSGLVVSALNQRGYDATNLDGGLKAWARAGLPLITPDGSAGRVI